MIGQKRKTEKQLDATMLAINSMLDQIYKNKSTDEYKMKGDITKSPSYRQIEEMIADLSRLKKYPPADAADMSRLFNTLHRPIFKTMVREYMMEHNDQNTLYTSMFTIGYRLMVGELARIFASTEATPDGIVYKPNKLSKKEDASKLIKLFNEDLEKKLNNLVQNMKKHPEDSPVNESYLMLLLDSLIQETVEPEEKESAENGAPGPVNEADEPVPGDDAPAAVEEEDKIEVGSGDGENDPGAQMEDDDSANDENTVTEYAVYQEDTKIDNAVNKLEKFAGRVSGYSKLLGAVVGSVAIIGSLFGGVAAILKGFNPIADINYYFMNSYDKKIAKLGAVASNYEATKKAYEEYMKIPPEQRRKKVESKYLKDMEKYNIVMNNLAAEIEHFDSRAKKESQEVVDEMEKKIPSNNPAPKPQGGDSGNTANSNDDDDFQF